MQSTLPVSQHSLFDDAQALVTGTLLISLGVNLLGTANLITGGTVGIAILLKYFTGVSFGKLFFLVNLPFYILAYKKMGRVFTLKTFLSVGLLSAWSELLPLVFKIGDVNPFYSAVMGGLLAGVGLLILFRHRASLGGVNVLVLFLQERMGLACRLYAADHRRRHRAAVAGHRTDRPHRHFPAGRRRAEPDAGHQPRTGPLRRRLSGTAGGPQH